MPTRSYILVVNGREVHAPVFVIGAPHSGTDLLARALKHSQGFHFTIGQPSVLNVVGPSPGRRRSRRAGAMRRRPCCAMRCAQAWQVTAESCLTCRAECQRFRADSAPGLCVDEGEISRYGDASPALMYCAPRG